MDLHINSLVAMVGLVATGIAILKGGWDIFLLKRSRLREEYRFAREFLADRDKLAPMHPFLRAKGLYAIVGTTEIQPDEIEHLLTLKGADKALANYTFGQGYLQFLSSVGSLKIEFKRAYRSAGYRMLLKGWYFIWYVAFALLAAFPFVFQKTFSLPLSTALGLTLVTVATFGPCAVLSLLAGVKVLSAEKLVANQEAHTQTVIVSMI